EHNLCIKRAIFHKQDFGINARTCFHCSLSLLSGCIINGDSEIGLSKMAQKIHAGLLLLFSHNP
ncbi:MAG: hypothetical protein NTU74_20290, partial [Deltaproteobacteria bacterium]|nr:hypothetical protein [Deltaproteobacteria bacterium]